MRLDLGLNLGILNKAGASAWTPGQLGSALAAWYDAEDASTITLNGSTVSQWSDKSGNNRHAVQTTAGQQPTYSATGYNSKPTLNFDGSNDVLSTTFNLDFPFTLATAVKNDVASGSVKGAIGSGNNRPALGILTASPASNAFSLWNPNVDRGAYINNSQRTTPVILGADAVSSNRLLWNVYVDGSNTGQTNENIGSLGSPSSLKIGQGGAASESWDGLVSEIILTNQVLSLANRQLVEGYLAWKWWGSTNPLPSDHPFKNSAPTV